MTVENKAGVADPGAESAESSKTVIKNNPEGASKKAASEKPDVASKSLIEVYKELRGLNDPENSEDDKSKEPVKKKTDEEESDEHETEGSEEPVDSEEEDKGAEGDESESAAEKEEEESEEGGDLPERARKRIGKLTWEKKELERKLQEALGVKDKPKTEEAPEKKTEASDSDLGQLEQRAKNLRGLIRQIDALVIRKPKVDDNGDEYWEIPDDRGNAQKLYRDRVAQMRLEYDTELNEQLPSRYSGIKQELELRTKTSEEMKKFKWWGKEESEGMKKFNFYKNHPRYKTMLKDFGESDAMLALIVQGELAMDAPRLSKASDKKKSARPPLPVSAPAPETEEEADAATVVKEYRRLKELARGSSSLTDPAVVKLMRFKEKHRSILQL